LTYQFDIAAIIIPWKAAINRSRYSQPETEFLKLKNRVILLRWVLSGTLPQGNPVKETAL